MNRTLIEWVDVIWSPVAGCWHKAKGCDFCNALSMRVAPGWQTKYSELADDKGRWTGAASFMRDALMEPSMIATPKIILTGACGDIFYEGVLDTWLDQVLAVVALNPKHRFVFLTRRPERMKEYFTEGFIKRKKEIQYYMRLMGNFKANEKIDLPDILPNVWLGVTVNTQEEADKYLPLLLQTPAVKRLVNIDMFEPIDLATIPQCNVVPGSDGYFISWVICSSEPDDKGEPKNIESLRKLKDLAKIAGIPFFFNLMGCNSAPLDIQLKELPYACE